jgi:hypothetical protein
MFEDDQKLLPALPQHELPEETEDTNRGMQEFGIPVSSTWNYYIFSQR